MMKLINRPIFSLLLNVFFIFTAVLMLYLSRNPNNMWFFIWIAFVPLLIGVENLKTIFAFIIATLAFGTAYYLSLDWFNFLAYNFMGIEGVLVTLLKLLLSVYLGLNQGIFIIFYKIIKNCTKIPRLIAAPITYAASVGVLPIVFKHSLIDTQIFFPPALQALDIFGPTGLEFTMVLSSCLILALLKGEWKKHKVVFAVSSLFFMGWWSYGFYNYDYWQKKQSTWPTHNIGIVQPNLDIKNRASTINNKKWPYINWEIEKTKELADKGASFVIWPEGKNYQYSENKKVSQAFKKIVAESNTNLIFGDIYKDKTDQKKFYNAMVWLKSDGSEGEAYFKRILMPFGEYIPFGNLVAKTLSKIGFDTFYPLSAGKKFVHFTDDKKLIKILPLICYETLFAENAAKMLARSQTQKNYHKLIVAISQDGWYDSLKQVYEHLYGSMHRAVETRTPFLHVVQNGPTTLAMPSGEHLTLTDYNTKDAKVVPIKLNPEKDTSFFVKFPWLTKIVVRLIFLAMLGYVVFLTYFKKDKANLKI